MRCFAVIVLLLSVPATAQAADDALSPAANQSFLATNAARPGVVSRSDGLQYRILASGFGKRPGPADTIQISFSGKLINGKIFDGTSPGLPVTLAVSALIRGLNEGVQLMHEGDRWQLVVPMALPMASYRPIRLWSLTSPWFRCWLRPRRRKTLLHFPLA